MCILYDKLHCHSVFVCNKCTHLACWIMYYWHILIQIDLTRAPVICATSLTLLCGSILQYLFV